MDGGFWKGALQSSAGEWVMILSLVFGGCCSNVWALEAVLKDHPKSGTFLTFAQFVYVTIQNLSSQLVLPKNAKGGVSWGVPKLRKREVPMKRWLVQVLLFLGVSLMNNYAFGLKIPVTVHIIFRSGGLCVSMLTGWFLAGKRYSFGQAFAGIIITVGIVLATLSAPRRKSPQPVFKTQDTNIQPDYLSDNAQYVAGIGLLSLALFLSAWLGLWQEETYKRYGKKWKEALFYTHFLSLPFFIPVYPTLASTYTSYAASPPVTLLSYPQPTPMALFSTSAEDEGVLSKLLEWRSVIVPSALFALGVNVITQGICIRGVNRLTSRVNSTTVNLVLTVRKAVSLGISVWYYGSGMTTGFAVGGAMVLVGTMVYSVTPGPKVTKEQVEHDGSRTENTSTGSGTAVRDKRVSDTNLRKRT